MARVRSGPSASGSSADSPWRSPSGRSAYGLLQAGVTPLIPLAIIFVALTLAGMPVVFMLSFVGILGAASVLGLAFFPFGSSDPLFPFRTTQTAMGLSSGSELLVIFEFLVVAEVMNATSLSARLIRVAAAFVGHFRGGMAYVCQLTSAMLSGISGSAQADAAVMTPLLVPAMEKEGYRREVAAAVVAGASIKGPVGPISMMYIVYGFIVSGSAPRRSTGCSSPASSWSPGCSCCRGRSYRVVSAPQRHGVAPPVPGMGGGRARAAGGRARCC